PVSVSIVHGLSKGDKWELVLQKGTELGGVQFIPYKAKRSVVKWDDKKGQSKVQRWEKIVKEASEQSHRVSIPTVCSPVTLKELLAQTSTYDIKLIAYEESAKSGEHTQLYQSLSKAQPGARIVAIFGPEGGLCETEVTELVANGWLRCGLGPRILRTETAPLYFLSAVSYHFEMMR
ncbi:MAG: RsmE family RNA methyltransferase, partial [Bacilli bacterium]